MRAADVQWNTYAPDPAPGTTDRPQRVASLANTTDAADGAGDDGVILLEEPVDEVNTYCQSLVRCVCVLLAGGGQTWGCCSRLCNGVICQ